MLYCSYKYIAMGGKMKLNKRLVTLGLIILVLSIAIKFVWAGLRQIKVDDFHPSAVIFLIDSSASNQKQLPEQKKHCDKSVICLTLRTRLRF